MNDVRTLLRNKRSHLTPSQQWLASQKIYQHLINDPIFKRSKKIAFYIAQNGEVDLTPAIYFSWQHNKQCYLPVIDQKHMRFHYYGCVSTLKNNRYRIPEPKQTRQLPINQLDLVLVPLVGFNWEGIRLGMGGGFYDRTFESPKERPILLGVAHTCQFYQNLANNDWDVPLDGIVTPEVLLWV